MKRLLFAVALVAVVSWFVIPTSRTIAELGAGGERIYPLTFEEFVSMKAMALCGSFNGGPLCVGQVLYGTSDANPTATFNFTIIYLDTANGRQWRDETQANMRKWIRVWVTGWRQAGHQISENDFAFKLDPLVIPRH